MTTSALKSPARVTLDLARLVEEGRMSSEEALRLRTLALPNRTNSLLANILFIFGAFVTVAGILALEPPLDVGLALAVLSIGAGAFLILRPHEEWGLLGQTLLLMGVLGLSGWASLRFIELGGVWPLFTAPFIAVVTLGGAVLFRNAVLAVLSPLALANLLGTGTEYWHACYGLYVEEPTISILVFGALAAGLFALRPRLPRLHELNVTLMARVSFILMNFGFWVGSLWGDHFGKFWFAPRYGEGQYASAEYDTFWEAYEAWQQHAFFVPDVAFVVGWLIVLAIAIYVGLRTQRRFISNTALVFLAIHFYTQFFERLHDLPTASVVVGLSLVVFAFGLARFDRWQKARIADREATGA